MLSYSCCSSRYPSETILDLRDSVLVTPPAVEPVSIEFVKTALSLDHYDLDEPMDVWITAARERLEAVLGRALARQTRQVALTGFHDAVRLPMPVHAADAVQGVTYLDEDGVRQTLATSAYRITAANSFMGAVLRPVSTYPSAMSDPESVLVTYEAGYPLGDEPACVKAAIAQVAGHMLKNREAYGTNVGLDASHVEIPGLGLQLVSHLRVTWPV